MAAISDSFAIPPSNISPSMIAGHHRCLFRGRFSSIRCFFLSKSLKEFRTLNPSAAGGFSRGVEKENQDGDAGSDRWANLLPGILAPASLFGDELKKAAEEAGSSLISPTPSPSLLSLTKKKSSSLHYEISIPIPSSSFIHDPLFWKREGGEADPSRRYQPTTLNNQVKALQEIFP